MHLFVYKLGISGSGGWVIPGGQKTLLAGQNVPVGLSSLEAAGSKAGGLPPPPSSSSSEGLSRILSTIFCFK